MIKRFADWLRAVAAWCRAWAWRRRNPHTYRLMVVPAYEELSRRYDRNRWWNRRPR